MNISNTVSGKESHTKCPYFIEQYVGVCIAAFGSPYTPCIVEIKRFCTESGSDLCPFYRTEQALMN